MMKFDLEASLKESNKGNEIARERIIQHYKPYILNIVGHLCRNYKTWSDEEASIGLIAFNRAIDTFNPDGGRTFLNYAYLLIERDLIDYFRKVAREHCLSIERDDDDDEPANFESKAAISLYKQNEQSFELVDEILELSEVLKQFNVSFEELEQHSPKHRDTRESLFQIATQFVEDNECVGQLMKKKRLPISLFSKKTGYRKKTLERHRKYVITLIVLKLNPHWVYLSQYIQEKSLGKEGKS
ncbi:RNA polymerase sigma-I factor [Texcoconibacillus texcoconensis]|uniref:RNA polymerase sigma factor SigI n=1 Tax=Texcoconibacillus texcoconensis TaxID=1095777 RepID=A0A840QTH8_9BACI|nr:RNA polymerase sigma-I factor [Texcoconibacillus texcoconensis]MBB5174650.1 RNA polymerase sigma factor [Texcoconibacillus texcoconensis]